MEKHKILQKKLTIYLKYKIIWFIYIYKSFEKRGEI